MNGTAPAVPPAAAWAERLQQALREAASPWAHASPEPMADKGLAHWHFRLPGTGLLARIPKQSQMDLPADRNLAYQAACFERAAASRHTPRLHGMLPPSKSLPRGALLVEEIVGRAARLPADLPAVAQALAAIHALPLPRVARRAPLLDPPSALAALLHEVDRQASFLAQAGIDAAARTAIERVRAELDAACVPRRRWPRRLIAFDAHPGNFLLRDDGRAVLVDLEKARYGIAALDLAHATLVTSTTWDIDSRAVLCAGQVLDAYARWQAALGDAAAGPPRLWRLARAAMWLWSVTWCAKWRVCSGQRQQASGDGEDWSQALSDARLNAHVRERVDDYLSAQRIDFVVDEFAQLARAWGA